MKQKQAKRRSGPRQETIVELLQELPLELPRELPLEQPQELQWVQRHHLGLKQAKVQSEAQQVLRLAPLLALIPELRPVVKLVLRQERQQASRQGPGLGRPLVGPVGQVQ
jgi:hypothetical protein